MGDHIAIFLYHPLRINAKGLLLDLCGNIAKICFTNIVGFGAPELNQVLGQFFAITQVDHGVEGEFIILRVPFTLDYFDLMFFPIDYNVFF